MPWDRATQAAINRALKAAQGRNRTNTRPPVDKSAMSPLQMNAAAKLSTLMRAPGQLSVPSELESRATANPRFRKQMMGTTKEGLSNTALNSALGGISRYDRQKQRKKGS